MNNQHLPLAGLRVLVTRPKHLAQPLCDAINALGAEAITFPTIEICNAPDQNKLHLQISQLASYHIAIFISPSAVQSVASIINESYAQLPNHLNLIAMGKGTSQSIADNGWPEALCPTVFNTEGVLALPILQEVQNKKIAIFCAPGGRKTLYDTLCDRGAEVTEIIAYERKCPTINPKQALMLWQNQKIDVIISTSGESLRNLWNIVGREGEQLLKQTPLLLISEYMSNVATQLAYPQLPIRAENASIEAIVDALINWHEGKVNE